MPPLYPIVLPEALRAALDAIRPVGRPLLVGGCVRDWLVGRQPKDFDVEVYGASPDTLTATLSCFGNTDPVGRSFGVIKLRLGGVDYDFALPRRETKTAAGHRGFDVGVDPRMSPAEALARRDFTINSMALDPFSQELIDPHGGRADLAAGLLRHTSDAFVEDPLRVLRAMQFAARFDFQLAPSTAALCRQIFETYRELPVERVWVEWEKWAAHCRRPSAGLRVLETTGWLRHFPELASLHGTPQDPEWHPEGDVFIHTCHCCDALAALPDWVALGPELRRDVMFGVLAHDFGKPSTTRQEVKRGVLRWVSPGHDTVGGPLAESFLERIGSPLASRPLVRSLVVNHFAHLAWPDGAEPGSSFLRRLACRLAPATIGQLILVLQADHMGRPPRRDPEGERRIEQLVTASRALAVADAAPAPLLLGRHLIAAGLQPGPRFKAILQDAYEAQLDGVFKDIDGAISWLRGAATTATGESPEIPPHQG
jgi:tRNA nucleotidyltransferase (CCA-adding enzyme)